MSRLRVYTISDQDDAGPWLRREFPRLFYIVSPSTTDWKEYWRATWTGISGDRHYKNGPYHKFRLVDNPWLEKNVIQDHGPLGALYPRLAYIMEGDTPSFLGLINHGLAWPASPSYGGWGGRYVLYQPYGETRPIWTNNQESRDTVTADNGQTVTSDPATVWAGGNISSTILPPAWIGVPRTSFNTPITIQSPCSTAIPLCKRLTSSLHRAIPSGCRHAAQMTPMEIPCK